MCTIRNTPSLIEHCIEWSRAKFTDIFVEPVKSLGQLVLNPEGFVAAVRADGGGRALAIRGKLPSYRLLVDLSKAAATGTFEACVQFAIKLFYQFFK